MEIIKTSFSRDIKKFIYVNVKTELLTTAYVALIIFSDPRETVDVSEL